MRNDNMGLRIIGTGLFVVIGILSVVIRLILFQGITFSIGYIIGILGFGAAYSIWKSDYKGPRIGIWLAIANIILALVEISLMYFLEKDYLISTKISVNPLYLDIPTIVISLLTLGICIQLFNVEKEKFKMEIENRDREKPENYGNCPKCGYDEIKFLDGVDYRCTRCGKTY